MAESSIGVANVYRFGSKVKHKEKNRFGVFCAPKKKTVKGRVASPQDSTPESLSHEANNQTVRTELALVLAGRSTAAWEHQEQNEATTPSCLETSDDNGVIASIIQ